MKYGAARLKKIQLIAICLLLVLIVIAITISSKMTGRLASSDHKPKATNLSAPPIVTHPTSTVPFATPTRPDHDYTLPPVTGGMVPVVSHIPTKEPVVFLTIDDGIWTSPNDAQVMQADHIKATFFLVYRFIHNNPAFFANLAAATGSDIENHSYDHYRLTNLTPVQQQIDICMNADIFTQWYGKRPVLFRPSGGAYDNDTLRAAATCGMRALLTWDVTVNNGSLQYQTGHGLRPGDIVLSHFRLTFRQDMDAFAAAAKAAGLQPELLINWL